MISLSVYAYTHKKIKKFRSCVSYCEALYLRSFFFLPVFMREKRKKCFCCAHAHKIALYVAIFFMFYAFMFYARIKWPPGPNFLCTHKTDTHINIKRKSAYVEPLCHKNTRTSHATTNNKKSCAHPTLQRLCPPLFMGRAEAPPNHVNAAPHHHTEAASCRGLLVWGELK